MSFQLKIKYNNRELVVDDVTSEMKVEAFKAKAAQAADVEINRVRLIYLGRVMSDANTLGTYRVQPDSVVHMIVKPQEVATPNPPPPSSVPSEHPSTSTTSSDDAETTSPAFNFSSAAPPGMDLGGLVRNLLGNVGPVLAAATSSAGRGHSATTTTTFTSNGQQTTTSSSTGMSNPFSQLFSGLSNLGGSATPPTTTTSTPHQTHVTVPPPAQQSDMTAHARSASPEASGGPIGVQIHLHVTLAELEEVPARLERLRQRLPGLRLDPTPVTVSTPFGTRPPGNTNQQAPVANLVDRMTREFRNASDPDRNTAQAQPSMAQLARECGVNEEDVPTSEQNLFDELSKQLMETLDMTDAMRMLQGDWSAVERARAPLLEYIRKHTGTEHPTPAQRRALAAQTARKAIRRIQSNDEFAGVRHNLEGRVIGGANALYTYAAQVLQASSQELIDVIVDGAPRGQLFSASVRTILVRRLGHAQSYAGRSLFRGGQPDVDQAVSLITQAAVQASAREHPQFASVAPMAGPMVQGFIRQWQIEYSQRWRQPNDDEIFSVPFSFNEPVASPLQTASAVTPTSPEGGDLDDILNEALSDQNDNGPHNFPELRRTTEGLDSRAQLAVVSAAQAVGENLTGPGEAYFELYDQK